MADIEYTKIFFGLKGSLNEYAVTLNQSDLCIYDIVHHQN